MDSLLREYVARAAAFERAAHDIFGHHEGSPSRVVILDESYSLLEDLSISQDDLMRQALRCVESALYRASHVMAWAAFMDFFEQTLASDGLVAVRAARPDWKHTASIEELREYESEFSLITLAQTLGITTK